MQTVVDDSVRMKKPTILSNEFRSPHVFYRAQQFHSGTTPPDLHRHNGPGFVAGALEGAKSFPTLDFMQQRDLVMKHAVWSEKKPSPFISTTDSLDKAIDWAEGMAKNQGRLYDSEDPVYIAVIRPGRVPTGTMKYFRWCDLVKDLEANISPLARNTHEYEFLASIPAETIVVYIKYERHRLYNLKDAIHEMVEDEGKDSVFLVVDSNSGI
jgi:hypothetical protein